MAKILMLTGKTEEQRARVLMALVSGFGSIVGLIFLARAVAFH